MKPAQISAETAQKLAESLNMPLERIMHMPQHILLAKLAEVQKRTITNKGQLLIYMCGRRKRWLSASFFAKKILVKHSLNGTDPILTVSQLKKLLTKEK